MKIGLLTTAATRCGIASYSEGLIEGFHQNGVHPTVFCNYSTGSRLTEPYPSYAIPVFYVPLWERRTDFFIQPILQANLDVLHVQYQSTFWASDTLNDLLTKLREQGTKIVGTFHDTSILPGVDLSLFDVRLSHRKEVPSDRVIPFGVEQTRPVIATFGIGRSRYQDVERVANELGYTYKVSKSSDKWLSREDLSTFLRTSDAIILWYDNVPVIGSSQAARTAIASRRPVFLNSNCQWFSDLDRHIVRWFSNENDLISQLRSLFSGFNEDYITKNSWSEVAKGHLNIYEDVLSAVDQKV